MKLSVLHIFGYGEVQIISDELNKKVKTSELTSLNAVINDVKSLKPKDVEEKDYHAINIFSDKIVYIGKGKDGKNGTFKAKFSDLDSVKLNTLLNEIKNK